MKMNKKELRMISLTLASWGLLCICSGIAMNTKETTVVKYNYSVTVSQNKVAESKTNEIKLKDMTLEVNTPLSVDVKDYLENIENIDSSVLTSLKLDTSKVNPQEAGTYTYTISYKRKTYNGTFTITAKQLPKVTITLRNITLKKDSALDTNLSTYIVETLTDEVKNNITLDLSAVKTNQEGTYQYKVIYNNQVYTANIEVYVPQAPTVITPNTNTDDNNNSNTNNNEENTTDTTTSTDTPTTTP